MARLPTTWTGIRDTRVPCPTCDGEGVIEYMLRARHAAQESPDFGRDECEDCYATGIASCEECNDDALNEFTVEGEATSYYCSAACQRMGQGTDDVLTASIVAIASGGRIQA